MAKNTKRMTRKQKDRLARREEFRLWAAEQTAKDAWLESLPYAEEVAEEIPEAELVEN